MLRLNVSIFGKEKPMSKFRFHLSTLIAMSLCLSILLGLNVRGGRLYESMSERHAVSYFGWPAPVLAHKYLEFSRQDKGTDIMARLPVNISDISDDGVIMTPVRGLIVDFGIMVFLLGLVYFLMEHVKPLLRRLKLLVASS